MSSSHLIPLPFPAQGADNILSEEQKAKWETLYRETDEFTDGWLSAGDQHS